MTWKIAASALKYVPPAICGAALALAGLVAEVKNALTDFIVRSSQTMNDPVIAISVALAVISYGIILIFCEVMASRNERSAPNLRGYVKHAIWGGEIGTTGYFIFFVDIELRNVGSMPSSIPTSSWIRRVKIGPNWSTIENFIMPDEIDMSGSGLRFVASKNDLLSSKAAMPIDAGAICEGFIVGAATIDQINALNNGEKWQIIFEDIRSKRTVISPEKPKLLPAGYLPDYRYGKIARDAS